MTYSVKYLIKVDKTKKARNDGKLIYCPECFYSRKVYHFAWTELWCLNKECDFNNDKSPNLSIQKMND